MPTAVAAEQHMLDDAAIESGQKRFESEAGVKAPCATPRPSDGARVVLLCASAESLSTVTPQPRWTSASAECLLLGQTGKHLPVVSLTGF
jgi:hypothetical protein